MVTHPSALDSIHAQPLVSCMGCGFAWYGRTSAHGLSVIGRCPRCAGELRFHGEAAAVETTDVAEPDVAPWRVLGMPTSWGD